MICRMRRLASPEMAAGGDVQYEEVAWFCVMTLFMYWRGGLYCVYSVMELRCFCNGEH